MSKSPRQTGKLGLRSLCVVAAGVVICAAWLTQARSFESGSRFRNPDENLQQVLRAESQGWPGRCEELERVTDRWPGCEPAWWLSGHVRLKRRWVSIDEMPDRAAHNRQVTAYRQMRDDTPDTAEGHLLLARWCATHGLADQERAHLARVIELAPDQPEAREKLGFRRIEGQWVSEEDVRLTAERTQRMERALARWRPKLQGILRNLDSNRQAVREHAQEELAAIDDPEAILPMEEVLSTADSRAALLVVDHLGEMPHFEATISLARHAVFASWQPVREAAADKLKERRMEEYVPILLASLVTPIEIKTNTVTGPNGEMRVEHVLSRETGDRKEEATFETAYRVMPTRSGDPWTARFRIRSDMQYRRRTFEAAVAQQNETSKENNERICWVLARATDGDLEWTIEDWWNWWNDRNEIFVPEEKTVEKMRQQQDVTVSARPNDRTLAPARVFGMEQLARLDWRPDFDDLPYPTDTPSMVVPPPTFSSGPPPSSCECLGAGTPVWTDLGPVAIEKIEVGDMVLSQDPETGELAYKPVLRTTVRPPEPLVILDVGEEAIWASGGHLFWVPGRGWTRARVLRHGQRLYGATDSQDLFAVTYTGSQETYNLIVADFHTYFAGKARLLCHDNATPQPTNNFVPGLARQ